MVDDAFRAARSSAGTAATVRRITTDGLVPPDELARYVRARLSCDDQVTVEDLCDEFDVPPAIARHAVWLAQARGAA